jgi:hypothetical protein
MVSDGPFLLGWKRLAAEREGGGRYRNVKSWNARSTPVCREIGKVRLVPCPADATTDARISRAPPHPPNAPESVPVPIGDYRALSMSCIIPV